MNTKNDYVFDETTLKNVRSWMEGAYDAETKKTITEWMEHSPEKLVDAFYTQLSFGTGGMRGLMDVGCNRMNVYTIRAATQGLANYILKQPHLAGNHRVMIGYDSRHNSRLFAEEAAKVLAGNGIQAHLFSELRPTPLVSFGCRFRKCIAAIMVTASHNPSTYNGYKVYWSDGAQVLPPHDKKIIEEVDKIQSPDAVKSVSTLKHPLIIYEGLEIDEAYLTAISTLPFYPKENHRSGHTLSLCYTPLHGTGITLVPEALRRWGFPQLQIIEQQAKPDGSFPTVSSPNPEEPAAMKLGIAQLEAIQGDLLLATDPDADRVGVAVRHQGRIELLNGNQIASLCVHHILEALKNQDHLPANGACIKTLTTTELFATIVRYFDVTCFDVLTGFKYIAEKIREWETDPAHGYTFLFGAEESYGYLLGTHSRDKDAVVSCALIAEIALKAKLAGRTLLDQLDHLYSQFGRYVEKLISINFPETKEGKDQMVNMMRSLRHRPFQAIRGKPVLFLEDYLSGEKTSLKDCKKSRLHFPASNVLIFRLENDGKIIVRPSGTEPKVKIYCALKDVSEQELKETVEEIRSTVVID